MPVLTLVPSSATRTSTRSVRDIDKAAIAALQEFNPKSIEMDREFGGPEAAIRTVDGLIESVSFTWGPRFTPTAEHVAQCSSSGDPFRCGLNRADRNAVDHIERRQIGTKRLVNPALLIPPPEPLDSAFDVRRPASAGEVGMALGADLHCDVRPRGASGNLIPAGATDSRFGVRWMDVFLHNTSLAITISLRRPGDGVNSGQPSLRRPHPIRRPSPTSPDRTAGTQLRRPHRPPARSGRSDERRRTRPEPRRPCRWG